MNGMVVVVVVGR